MREPIKVTREQYDAAVERCGKDCTWAVLGPRPAPDTPPDLREGWKHIASASENQVLVDADASQFHLLLPWFEEHLLPWLRAQVEEANDA